MKLWLFVTGDDGIVEGAYFVVGPRVASMRSFRRPVSEGFAVRVIG